MMSASSSCDVKELHKVEYAHVVLAILCCTPQSSSAAVAQFVEHHLQGMYCHLQLK